MQIWVYVIYFWQNATKEMVEDMLELSIDEIKDYIIVMGKYFYEADNVQVQNNEEVDLSLWPRLRYVSRLAD